MALVAGERDLAVLAEMAKRRLRVKIPELTEALTGRFNEHHGFLVRLHLDLIDQHTQAIEELPSRIEVVMAPFHAARDLIVTIPGISTSVSDVVIAETGGEMNRFPTASHLASWAGTCPGSNQSAAREVEPYASWQSVLEGSSRLAALSACHSHGTYYSAKYRRIASRRGPVKAVVAIEHAMLIAIWNILSSGELYRDPGDDLYTWRRPEKATLRAVDQLRRMRYLFSLEPIPAAG